MAPSGERLRRKGRHGYLQIKLCDPCLSALRYTWYIKWRYTNTLPFLFLSFSSVFLRLFTCPLLITKSSTEEEEKEEEMEAEEEEVEEEEEEEMEVEEEPPEITASEAAMLVDPDPWKRFAAETTVAAKRTRREDADFYRRFEPAAASLMEEEAHVEEKPRLEHEVRMEVEPVMGEKPRSEPEVHMEEEPGVKERPAVYAPPDVPDVFEFVSAPPVAPDHFEFESVPPVAPDHFEFEPPRPETSADELAAYTHPEVPSDMVVPLQELQATPAPTPAAPAGAPCEPVDDTSTYVSPEAPSATIIVQLPDDPAAFSRPETPSRTIIRDGVSFTMEPEDEAEFAAALAPSETALYDARRDPCFVETFVDFQAKEDADMREAIWREEQAKRTPGISEEYRGWLDVKLDRTCRGVAVSVPEERAPENMFFDFGDPEEKCARDAIWREQQKEVDKEVVTPSFFGWREWMKMDEGSAPIEVEPSKPRVLEDFETEQERKFREGVWKREQMEPCPDAVLKILGQPPSPRRVPVEPEQPREVCLEETFSDFPNEQERHRRETIWQEEQSKVLETVFGEKIVCGEKPRDVYRLDTFHDFPDSVEKSERDEIWQKEQEQLFVPTTQRVFDGWQTVVMPVFSDYDGMTEEQVRTRRRLWLKEQTKRPADGVEAPFEGWEAGRDRSVVEMFEDFPDTQQKAVRDVVWNEEQKKVYEGKGEHFEGWPDDAEKGEPEVVASFVEMFRDYDDSRERCACDRAWQEEQNKRSEETCERFDGWNEWEPSTRVAEGQRVVETYEERGPHMPGTFEDFPEPEQKRERDAVWRERQTRMAPPEKKTSVFDGWEKKPTEEEEGRTFWDFPDKEESCRRQKIWHEEQAKVRPNVEIDECGNRVPVFHGWGPKRVPCEKKEFVSPPAPQLIDELAADYETESLMADEREADAVIWNEFQLEQITGALSLFVRDILGLIYCFCCWSYVAFQTARKSEFPSSFFISSEFRDSSELGSRNSEIYGNSSKQIKRRNLTFSYKLISI